MRIPRSEYRLSASLKHGSLKSSLKPNILFPSEKLDLPPLTLDPDMSEFTVVAMNPNIETQDNKKSINTWKKKNKDPERFPSTYSNKCGFVMRLFDHHITVGDFLEKNRDLSLEQKLRLLISILKELEKLHLQNIIHNDLNLGNLLICDNQTLEEFPEVEIIDYDFARIISLEEQVVSSKENPKDPNDNNEIPCATAREQFPGYKDEFELLLQSKSEYQEHELFSQIENIERILNDHKVGFCSKYSDIFCLGRQLSFKKHLIQNMQENSKENFLQNLFAEMTAKNPFERPSLSQLIEKCESKYNLIQTQKVIYRKTI